MTCLFTYRHEHKGNLFRTGKAWRSFYKMWNPSTNQLFRLIRELYSRSQAQARECWMMESCEVFAFIRITLLAEVYLPPRFVLIDEFPPPSWSYEEEWLRLRLNVSNWSAPVRCTTKFTKLHSRYLLRINDLGIKKIHHKKFKLRRKYDRVVFNCAINY